MLLVVLLVCEIVLKEGGNDKEVGRSNNTSQGVEPSISISKCFRYMTDHG